MKDTVQYTKGKRPGYKMTRLGWVPVEWELRKLEEIVEPKRKISYGIVQTGPNVPEGIKCIRVVDLQEGQIDEEKLITTSEEISNSYKKTLLKEGDLIIALRGKIGQLAIVSASLAGSNLTRGLALLAIRPIFDNTFYYHHLSSPLSIGIFLRQLSGSALQEISIGVLRKIPVVVPPLPEQQKIAAILSTWDRAIELTQQLIEAKEEQRRGVMQRLLTGKVRLAGYEKIKGQKKTNLGLTPKDWEVLKASDIFKNISKKNNDGQPLLAVTQENGVIPRDMLEGRVTMPAGSTKSYKLVVPGNFVISLRSFQGGLEYSEYKGIVSPAYTVLKNRIPINNNFFKAFFKSQEFISRLAVAVIGIRDGKQISYSDFSAMTFRYPPVEEQRAIGKVIDTLEQELTLIKHKLNVLKQQKKGLMQQLLTGKIRVHTDT